MRKFGLIGFPLGHSFSAGYFADKFNKEKIADCVYENFPLEHIDDLKKIIQSNPELCGLNVTIPYKEVVLPFLDELDESACEIGAVNTIKLTRSPELYMKGFNTDSYGFEISLKPFLEPVHKKALILGTGGAAKAVVWVLERLGIETRYVSRVPRNKGVFAYGDIDKALIEEFQVIVNCSPLGMFPHIDQFPDIPYQFLGSKHILYDLIYNPEETQFLNKGKQQRAKTINGLPMLYGQAEKAWEIWNV